MLAVTLLAVAGFMVIVVRLSARRRSPAERSEAGDLAAGFIYIGAAALAVLGVVVFAVGQVNETFAGNLAMLALFGGCAYLLVAVWFVRRQ